jgi:energy-coupling factor transporter ATP-binding protein EcfA2
MYDFRTLSPLGFEELVRDLLQEELSLRFESFGPGRDLGVDFRFATASGRAIVQVKHYADSGTDALIRAARLEDGKVRKLKPARYILATSLALSPHLKAKLRAAMPSAPLVEEDIFGRTNLNNLLGRHPGVERRHFKLWLASTTVLERILHSGVYNRTQAEMDVIKAMVPKFVHNESIPQAEAVLQKSRALIIAGEPGVGKSTLARMLIWLHAEQNWRISVIDDIKEAFDVAHDGEKHLIFFDDFLGQVPLSTDLIRSTDQRFPPFLQRVRSSKNLRFILTTRDYILHQAQAQSSRLSSTAVNTSELVLDVGYYTRAVRARMLFNHIYFSDLTAGDCEALLADDFFLRIIDHRNFNPRLIELLTSAEYVTIAGPHIRSTVESVLANPHELWDKPYRKHISDEGRALMLALFFNDARAHISAVEKSFARIADAMELHFPQADLPARFRSAVKEIEGSVLAIQDRHFQFANPGIRDFLQRAISEDRFLPTAVRVIGEFDELTQAWSLFLTVNDRKRTPGHPMTEVWFQAIERLVGSSRGTALERLGLLVDMSDQLDDEKFLPLIDRSMQELGMAGIEWAERRECVDLIERLSLSLLPIDTQDKAIQTVCSAAANMIANEGNVLAIDEIRSLSNALSEYHDDKDIVKQAVRAALRGHIEELDQTLEDFGSIDELDDYEKELNSIMTTYGVNDERLDTRIKRCRRELRDDNDQEPAAYSAQRVAKPYNISNDEIRSIFEALRKS